MCYIILYADEFPYDIWKTYCDICGVSYNSDYIKIRFNEDNVKSN